MNPLPYNEPYNNSGSFLFRKSGVYYFVRRVPTDLARHHTTRRISFSLRTRSAAVAKRQAYEIAAKLDRHWHDLRMSDDNLLSRYQRKITPSSDTITQSVGISGVGGASR
ncbi:hypothetical protein PUH89_13705 [Rhodobacter capsulatus]|uniref:DUF6538 domain-containing protein n=1 Tax=Rhodobacter capsulatus TaxID=1061 RepID=UPI0023E0C80D|nr:DUF6538 domain-containing protein [Rhodobacter capsulatus]WER08367.1 hypothetical protein PUH89_13705 [Rhodobacter capsulatus]